MARVKKPTVKQPAIIAPAPARTLLGPQATKLPAKPARKRAQPPPIPKPGTKTKRAPLDPAAARAALAAVLAAPAHDAPRATYAALLTAAGDPRGELITLGLASDREPRELLARHGASWTKPLKALGKPTRWRWRRGFVEELRVNGWDAGCTPGNLAVVLAAEPVTELVIEGCDPEQLARLLAVPGIERLRRLAVSGWHASEGGTFLGRIIGRAKRLAALAELRVGIKLGDAGVLALADADPLGAVAHLALAAPEASTETFAVLAASPLGQRVEVLEWLQEPITPPMAQVLVTMPSLHTFVGSAGYVDGCRSVLAARFRARFVVEDAPQRSLLDGVKGVSHRPAPKR